MPAPVFTFSRSESEILQELLRVFSSSRGSAREQWSIQAELLVEPTGWDALWKLSKTFCKKFDVRFPCVAYVSVNQVDFDNLSATVDVLKVQHETVSLPEIVPDVPLVELWPTEKQREACVNAATTAEFIDLLRFYFNHIWMPWDNQDDKILLPDTIEERMQLWSELRSGNIPACLARNINSLRNSAIDAHEKLKELDCSLNEGGLADDDDSLLPPSYISTCAEMNARLDGLMAKWTLYENPLIREQYLAKMMNVWQKNRNRKNVVALWEGGSVFEFDEISQFLRARVESNQTLTLMTSAEEALALDPVELIICSKEYEIPECNLSNIALSSFNGASLSSNETRSCLLLLSEATSVRDVTLHCNNVNTCIVAKGHPHTIDNCVLREKDRQPQSDFAQGLVVMPDAKILIQNTTFDNFYTAIVVHKNAQVELRNCSIKKCGVGIQMYSGARVSLAGTAITDCSEQSVRCELDPAAANNNTGDGVEGLTIAPTCTIGKGDLQKEIMVVKQDVELF